MDEMDAGGGGEKKLGVRYYHPSVHTKADLNITK
jgi:hypothetical protein